MKHIYKKILALFCILMMTPSLLVSASDSNPDDRYFSRQWGFYNDGESRVPNSIDGHDIVPVEGVDVNIKGAWSSYTSSKEVVVAIIDTGVDFNHSDLKNNMWINKSEVADNGKDDDGNGYIDDVYGWNFYSNSPVICTYNSNGRANPDDNDNHGTHCAGTIAAVSNNSIGIAGIASNVNVKIMSLKVAGGKDVKGKTSNIVKAIRYADKMGAVICNISLNSNENNLELRRAMQESSMLFVCSSGNSTTGVDIDSKKTYPASYKLANSITVAAVQSDGIMAPYSNYGRSSVSVAAPGTNIYSTMVGSAYGYYTGTSMAAPFVTGIAAMIATTDDRLYAKEIKELLESSVTRLETLDGLVKTGGMINAGTAVANAKKYSHKADTTAPSLTVKGSFSKNSGTIQATASDKGSSGLKAIRYAFGKQAKSYFKNGTNGNTFSGSSAAVSKKGTYTVYAVDHAGNSVIKYITLK